MKPPVEPDFDALLKAWRPEPVLVCDTREQQPLLFSMRSELGTLATGDYALKNLESEFCIERKSLPDLIGSLTTGRERFFREMDRLRAIPFRRLLIIGTQQDVMAHNYRSSATPASILASVATVEARYLIPAVWVPDAPRAAEQVERWARYFFREQTVKLAERMRQSV